MSDENTQEAQLQYYERLNIPVLSIAKAKDELKKDFRQTLLAWDKGYDVKKQCFHLIGPAGVGKTEICYQIADELTESMDKQFDIIMVKAPVLSRDDFIIPFPTKKGQDMSFRMLYSDFVPKGKDTYGLFIIDEFSRGDHTLQQLLWQVQNEYAVHRYEFPKHWFVVSVDNPDDPEYSMDNLEDAAGLRRQLHMYIEVNAIDFLNYAIEKKFHPLVIEYIQTFPERIYDFQAQKQGSVYANPASYEKVSDILIKMELDEGLDFESLENRGGGLLNTHMTAMFVDFAKEKNVIKPKDIFFKFAEVKPKLKELLTQNNNAKLGEVMIGFSAFMTTSMPKYGKAEIKNVLDFLLMMPIDTAAIFISQIDKFDRKSDAFKYMTKLHLTLMSSSKKYKEDFYEPIVQCGEGKLK